MGDSGDELGEGSVRAESTVEIVVVGDDSADSKVEAESRRMIGDEKCELGEGRFATFTGLFDEDIANASPPIDRCRSAALPKMDIKDGKEAIKDGELAVPGILIDPASFDRFRFVDIEDCAAREVMAVCVNWCKVSSEDGGDNAVLMFGTAKSFANIMSVRGTPEQVTTTTVQAETVDNLHEKESCLFIKVADRATDDV